ncbi:MAG: hypothetical protein MUC35_03460 [Candidatus Margulisbacteria bacterium]|jgi:hypothetical protein|nr:hypothetical protein [Candidatus Margulisiibacteriota bacterium]
MISRKGQVLVAAIFVLVIVSFLGLIVTQMLSNEGFSALKTLHGIQALNVAEGGVRYTVTAKLAPDTNWYDNNDFGPVSLGSGTFTVRYLAKQMYRCTLEVVGTVSGVNRTVRASFKRVGGGLQSLAAQYTFYGGAGGTGSSSFGLNTVINGDIMVNNDIDLNGAVVNGTVEATGTITDTGGVTGTTISNIPPPESRPSLETTYFDNYIATANTTPTYTGNRTFSGNLAPGTYYIKGNVTLDTLTLSLTEETVIVATGTVSIGNNKVIGDNLTVICAGELSFGNNNSIGNDGLWYSGTSITIGNAAEVSISIGAGTAFITPGDFTVLNSPAGDSNDLSGFIYAGGTATLGNNSNMDGLISAGNLVTGNGLNLTTNPEAIDFNSIPGIICAGLEGDAAGLYNEDWVEFY